ncbi:hypothetical protein HHI36_016963 [Cryptolaemus montrouzieri]|uniref:PHD-type domain-containing protein n=1 Tax=Cryptolaemus montrouzieri TaxID=559131 RepID=A0ABD2NLY7_9CUCU
MACTVNNGHNELLSTIEDPSIGAPANRLEEILKADNWPEGIIVDGFFQRGNGSFRKESTFIPENDCDKCSASNLRSDDVAACDKCDTRMCKPCSGLPGTEMRAAVLQRRNMTFWCPKCLKVRAQNSVYKKTMDIIDLKLGEFAARFSEELNRISTQVGELKESYVQLVQLISSVIPSSLSGLSGANIIHKPAGTVTEISNQHPISAKVTCSKSRQI